MADHSKPTVTSAYANFVTELDARLDDLAMGCDPARTTVNNPATGTIRWTSAGKKWEKWSGSAWGDLSTGYAIPIVGGSVDNSPIGATTPNTGKFTSLTVTGNATINGYAEVVRNSDGWLLRHARSDGLQVCGVKSYGHSAAVGLGLFTNDIQRVWLSKEGTVGIGAAPGAADVLRIGGMFSSASSAIAANANAAIPASVTGRATYFATMAATAAASFSMSSLVHFDAAQGVFGAGSNVENQYGFLCESSLIGATKNYGFYGNIPSGTDRWNFYAGGSAANLFTGTTYIGGIESGFLLDGGSGGLIRHRVVGAGQLDISSEPQDGTSAASVRIFRYTNTTGNVVFSVLVGDNSPTRNHFLAGNNNQLSALCNNNGRVRIGNEADTGAKLQIGGSLTMSGPMRLGQYTLSTLPSAAAYSGHLIDVTNATGGAKVCRSNGSVWQVLNTTTTVS